MLDPDLLESLEKNEREMVKNALMTLASTGVLLAQKERLFRRVAEGSDTDDHEELTTAVLRYRKDSHGLIQMHNQGEQYLKENES